MDFKLARFNMVEQQIRPWDVLNFDLLDILNEIPREQFVQDTQKNISYTDNPLPLANGSYMLEPKIVARLIQALELSPTDQVMEIGTGSGYATAVLSRMAQQVFTFDIDAQQQSIAKQSLDSLSYQNITYENKDGLLAGHHANFFNAIYIGGAVPSIPQTLLTQLAEGGRLVTVTGSGPIMQAKLVEKIGADYKEKILFDTLIPTLENTSLNQPSTFTF